jgi:hypothetical protein
MIEEEMNQSVQINVALEIEPNVASTFPEKIETPFTGGVFEKKKSLKPVSF